MLYILCSVPVLMAIIGGAEQPCKIPKSLHSKGFRDLLKKFFTYRGDKIFNSPVKHK